MSSADCPFDVRGYRQVGALILAVSATITAVLPAFLVGALAVQIQADLDVGSVTIGLAAAALFAISGLSARRLGTLVQRLGWRWGIASAAVLSTITCAGCAVAPSPAWLVAAMLVGGVANGMVHPAVNLLISELLTDSRLGLAFGIKQSSIPAATLLGGLSVPAIALVFGWRWVFGIAGLLAAAVAVSAAVRGDSVPPSDGGTDGRQGDLGLPRRALSVLSVGAGLGMAAATSLGVFLVDSGVRAGLEPGQSGLLFAASSLFGLVARVGCGWLADLDPHRSLYLLIASLLAWGASGYVLLAIGTTPLFVLGSLLAYAVGWAWTGLMQFAIVKDNRAGAAAATGFLQTGTSLGAATGPFVFGLLVEITSYRAAWSVAACLSLSAAVVVRVGRRMVRRSRGLPVRSLRWRPS